MKTRQAIFATAAVVFAIGFVALSQNPEPGAIANITGAAFAVMGISGLMTQVR